MSSRYQDILFFLESLMTLKVFGRYITLNIFNLIYFSGFQTTSIGRIQSLETWKFKILLVIHNKRIHKNENNFIYLMSKINKYKDRTINLNSNKLFRMIIVEYIKPIINSKSNCIFNFVFKILFTITK